MADVMICPKGCRDLKPGRLTLRFVRRRETAEYLQKPVAAHSRMLIRLPFFLPLLTYSPSWEIITAMPSTTEPSATMTVEIVALLQ